LQFDPAGLIIPHGQLAEIGGHVVVGITVVVVATGAADVEGQFNLHLLHFEFAGVIAPHGQLVGTGGQEGIAVVVVIGAEVVEVVGQFLLHLLHREPVGKTTPQGQFIGTGEHVDVGAHVDVVGALVVVVGELVVAVSFPNKNIEKPLPALTLITDLPEKLSPAIRDGCVYTILFFCSVVPSSSVFQRRCPHPYTFPLDVRA
jgi:hypothetical protein